MVFLIQKKLMIRGVPKTIEPLLQDVADGVSLRISGCSMFSFSIQFQGCNVGTAPRMRTQWDFGMILVIVRTVHQLSQFSKFHQHQPTIQNRYWFRLGQFWWILVILNEQKKAQRHRSRICWSLGPHLRTRRAWWGGGLGRDLQGKWKLEEIKIFSIFFNHILFHISNISYQILCFDDMFHIVSSYLAMLCWLVNPILPYFFDIHQETKTMMGMSTNWGASWPMMGSLALCSKHQMGVKGFRLLCFGTSMSCFCVQHPEKRRMAMQTWLLCVKSCRRYQQIQRIKCQNPRNRLRNMWFAQSRMLKAPGYFWHGPCHYRQHVRPPVSMTVAGSHDTSAGPLQRGKAGTSSEAGKVQVQGDISGKSPN
jgi:hypothetical protein